MKNNRFATPGSTAAISGRTSPPRRRVRGRATALLAGIACAAFALTGATSALAGAGAHAAGGMYIKESAALKRTGKHGFKLYERGYVGGTIKGSIYIELDVVATNRVTAKVSVYPRGSAIYGYCSAAYHVHGAYAEFSGALSITGGSGSYKGAHGKGLKFSGRISRSNDAVSVSLSGNMYR